MSTFSKASLLVAGAMLTTAADVNISTNSTASRGLSLSFAKMAHAQISPHNIWGDAVSAPRCCALPSAPPVTPPVVNPPVVNPPVVTPPVVKPPVVTPPVVKPPVVTPPVTKPNVPTPPGKGGNGAGGKSANASSNSGGNSVNINTAPGMAMTSGWCMNGLSLSGGAFNASAGVSLGWFSKTCGSWYAAAMGAGSNVCVVGMFNSLRAVYQPAGDPQPEQINAWLKQSVETCHPQVQLPPLPVTPKPYSKLNFTPWAQAYNPA